MFHKLLIANRGEIACRVMHTAQYLGIRTIAVYSEADAAALHVAIADEAHLIGPAAAAESYLKIDAILDVAKRSGAEAIHPGYGFLSENADFAEACAKAGFLFVGPPPDAIRAMGSKSEAKALMEKAGVPLIPGYHGAEQDPAKLAKIAGDIGYPVLIKASAGGGGKGMRLVERATDFDAALASAKREAAAAFGDDRVLIEKYLTTPRHIEVQVFADNHGHCVHLFERDCSIQRRHQKVLEEAPAFSITESRRAEIGAAAVAAAKAIGYRGAGTVEFMAEGDAFYFMEMNTRLQVEHPVTEMITGQDLVAWQFSVAAGEPLPLMQNELSINGHAIEVRIYAEDPAKDFMPATGRLVHLKMPEEGPHVRIDSGVRESDEVSVHYDPMIAKLIVWDRDRPSAIRRLKVALEETEVVGFKTNIAFLHAIAQHAAFAAGDVDTGFAERHYGELVKSSKTTSDDVLALACLAELLHRRQEGDDRARRSSDPFSPWTTTSGWRLNVVTHNQLKFLIDDREVAITVHYKPDGYLLDLPGGQTAVAGEFGLDAEVLANIAGRRIVASAVRHDGGLTIILPGASQHLKIHDPLDLSGLEEVVGDNLVAPMPSKVSQVLVEAGATVTRGTLLMILEAMKMEHSVTAPTDGTVIDVLYAADDLVEEGAELIVFEKAGK